MEQIKVFLDTDWCMFFASISSGIFAAIATLIAVWLTNRETRKQLKLIIPRDQRMRRSTFGAWKTLFSKC